MRAQHSAGLGAAPAKNPSHGNAIATTACEAGLRQLSLSPLSVCRAGARVESVVPITPWRFSSAQLQPPDGQHGFCATCSINFGCFCIPQTLAGSFSPHPIPSHTAHPEGANPKATSLAWPSAAGGTDAGKHCCVTELPAARHVQTYPLSAGAEAAVGPAWKQMHGGFAHGGSHCQQGSAAAPPAAKVPTALQKCFHLSRALPAITLPSPCTPSTVFAPSLPQSSCRGSLHCAEQCRSTRPPCSPPS